MNYSLFDHIKKFKKRNQRISKNIFDSSLLTKELNYKERTYFWETVSLGFIVLLTLLILISKSFNLQIIHGDENLLLAEGNRIRIIDIYPERGLLLDRNGETVVRNLPAFSISVYKNTCLDNCESDIRSFSARSGLEVGEDIESVLNTPGPTAVVFNNISKDELILIEPMLLDFPSLSISVTPQRDYLLDNAASHLLGYVGFADTLQPVIEGKMGIEKSYNSFLKGIQGGEIVQVDSQGRKIETLSHKESEPGSDIQLYMDKGLQELAYNVLKDKVEESEAVAGAIVAQDPQTGGILAMVSYPSFDPNEISSGISQKRYEELSTDPKFPFFNRVVSATYPPASTFKMIMASAALAEDIISPTYQIFDPGYIQVGSYIFRNWNTSGHGNVDLLRALQVSNDTYFYTVGGGYGEVTGLGIDRISKWSKAFGLGGLTGIDIPGEVAGFVPDSGYKDWYLGDTYISSIGQGDFLTTPLQMNNVTSYFANGGFLFVPKTVKAIAGVKQDVDVISQGLISSGDYEIVREGLKRASQPGGTAYPMYDIPTKFGVEVAGKTGTAEFGAVDNEDTHAWYTAFGPYENASIAVTVFLEEGGSGSDDAAAVARELFEYWFNNPENL